MPTPNRFDAGSGVAFLGPAGTYSHTAARTLFDESTNWQPVGDIRDVFLAVESGRASWGVVPVENSSEGSVTATLDAFVNSPVRVCAELLLRIHHCLLAVPGTTTEGLKRIFSHPQSLGQCRHYLDTNFAGTERVAASSNAEAARLAAATPGTAAIAGKGAASLYGLQVLAESIEDAADNTTRFLLLNLSCVTRPCGRDKTSLLVSAPDEPGTLFHALEPFFRFGVSLTKLETRPSRVSAWSYSFYMEFEGHIDNANVTATLDALKTLKLDVKWLGSYAHADPISGQFEPPRRNAVTMPVEKQAAEVVAAGIDDADIQLISNRKIVIVGLGLIGGSIARGISKLQCGCEIVAVGRNTNALQVAKDDGSISAWSTDLKEVCGDADLIILGMPVLSMERGLQELAPLLSANSIVTDVASVKGAVVEAAQRVWGTLPANFVPGHPIAGSERSGYAASKADLYRGRKVILTPLEHTNADAVEVVAALWKAIGAEVLLMSVEHHDAVLAATSHLPHLLAFALVDTLSQQGTREEIFRYAAGGFRDFTRIASSDPVMWRDIFVTNADATVRILDEYMVDLQRLRDVLLKHDGDELLRTFKRANASRNVFLALNDKTQRRQE